MLVAAWRSGRVTAEGEKPAIAAMAAELGELFASTAPPERRALYVVSSNAGVASSLAFWSGAAREGVAYASPALFPWTLSNAPCGWLAREFGVRGPNVTHTGRADALSAALHQCWIDLEQRQADQGWVVAIDFGLSPGRPTTYAAMRVTIGTGPVALERSRTLAPSIRQPASHVLARTLKGATRDGCSGFSDGHTTWTVRAQVTWRANRRARPT